MFYEFDEKKYKEVNPPFLGLIETPLVVRALRHGMMLMLEDLYTPFNSAMD